MLKTLTCEMCGKTFESKVARAKCCSIKCRNARYRMMHTSGRKLEGTEWEDKLAEHRAKVDAERAAEDERKGRLARLEREAREKGISYGRLQAIRSGMING